MGTWAEEDPAAGPHVQAEEQRWEHLQGALVEDEAVYHLFVAEPAAAHASAVLGPWAGHTDQVQNRVALAQGEVHAALASV